MKDEKLNLSLIEEDKTSLPRRGGNYVSDEEKARAELEKTKKKLRDYNSNRDHGSDSKDDDHPFFWGEGSCR